MLLTGCLGAVWTGANLVYDRHTIYEQLDDYQLTAEVNHVLFHDKIFRQPGCSLDAAVFHGDVLLAGHVRTEALRQEAIRRVRSVHGYRRFINRLALHWQAWYPMQDSWITAKIRSRIFANSAIAPRDFKIVTSDGVVYLMGDVDPDQAALVVDIARNTEGVSKVVRLFRYVQLTATPSPLNTVA